MESRVLQMTEAVVSELLVADGVGVDVGIAMGVGVAVLTIVFAVPSEAESEGLGEGRETVMVGDATGIAVGVGKVWDACFEIKK